MRSNAPPLPQPPTTSGFVTDMEIEYLQPVYVGDRLTSRGRKLLSVNIKRTSVGFGAFTVSESELVNQRGELVARIRNGGYAYNPGATS
jgi:acyl dehydratase